MTTATKILAASAALGLLGLATVANAAPVGALTAVGEALKAEAALATDQVSYRCWRYRHHVRCGNIGPRVYSYYAAPRRYYGYAGPALSFRFGGYRRWY